MAARAASSGVSPCSMTHASPGRPPTNTYQPPESWARGPSTRTPGRRRARAARRASSSAGRGAATARPSGVANSSSRAIQPSWSRRRPLSASAAAPSVGQTGSPATGSSLMAQPSRTSASRTRPPPGSSSSTRREPGTLSSRTTTSPSGAGSRRVARLRPLGVDHLLGRHVAPDVGGEPGHELGRGHIARHQRPRGHECLGADLDAREDHHPTADARAAADDRPLDPVVARLGAAHEVVVGGGHAGRDEDVVLELGVGGDVRVRLDLRERPDRHVVLDADAPADDHALADRAALAHGGEVADDRVRPQSGAGVDERAAADGRALADLERRQRLPPAGGARGQLGLLAQHDVVLDHDAVADAGAVVDDHVGADLDVLADDDALSHDEVLAAHARASSARRTGSPEAAREALMASRTSTTTAPARPSEGVGLRSRTAWAKRSHTTRSGSVAGTFGMWMSPDRTWMYSPYDSVRGIGPLS